MDMDSSLCIVVLFFIVLCFALLLAWFAAQSEEESADKQKVFADLKRPENKADLYLEADGHTFHVSVSIEEVNSAVPECGEDPV